MKVLGDQEATFSAAYWKWASSSLLLSSTRRAVKTLNDLHIHTHIYKQRVMVLTPCNLLKMRLIFYMAVVVYMIVDVCTLLVTELAY